jgi:hypothetical protein
MTAEDELVERELTFNRFRKLIVEVLQGGTRRTEFHRWEVDILIDLHNCALDTRCRAGVLHQYLKAVRKQLDAGPGPPMLLSEFLQRARTRRPSSQKRPESTMRIASG